MNTLDKQVTELEEAIEKASDSIVRQALQEKLVSVKKKIASKSGRTATSADGGTIRIGDSVWVVGHYNPIYVEEYAAGTKELRKVFKPASIHLQTVTGISPTGKEISFTKIGGYRNRHDYELPVRTYLSRENALAATVAYAERNIIGLERSLEEQQERLQRAKMALAAQKGYVEEQLKAPKETFA